MWCFYAFPSRFPGHSSYPCMAHLTEMDRRNGPTMAPGCCHTAVVHEWVKQLADHPDRAFRDYIVSGISHRFRIGFKYDKCSCRPAKANMPSAIENPSVVQAHLDVEVALGRVCGPVQSQLTNQVVEADTRLFKPG